MKCITYARVSTQEQADRELSIPAQQQAMREYAQRQGWEVIQEFVEAGVSGRSTDRPALQELLSRCKRAPAVEVVLVHKIDRLARNVFDHATIRAVLKQHKIRLASVVENVDDSISGQLVENIMASIAEFYSANLGEEVKKGMQMKVEKGGWPHRPPRGYLVVKLPNGGREIQIDPKTGPIIQEMFERYATGMCSVRDICKFLTESGVRNRVGKEITLQHALDMLKNGFYAGRVQWHGAERAGTHPALISEDLFVKVRETIKTRQKDYYERGKLSFMLRGVAKCGDCGYRMTAERHGRFSYYRCVRNTVSRKACSASFSNVALSHDSLLALYRVLCVPNELKKQIQQSAQHSLADRIKAQRSAQASLSIRKSALEAREIRVTESLADGAMSREAYRQVAEKIRKERIALEKESAGLKIDPEKALEKLDKILRLAESLYDLHKMLPPADRTKLVRLVFQEIVLNKGAIVSYKLHPPFDGLLVPKDKDDTPTGDLAAPELDMAQIESTIRSVLEFDDTVLRSITVSSSSDVAA